MFCFNINFIVLWNVFNVLIFYGEEFLAPRPTPRCRWEDNINMDCQDVRMGDMDWIDLAQEHDRWQALGNVVMNSQIP
jgi:hypothetical protein